MTHRPVRDQNDVIEALQSEVKELRRRLNQPRTRIKIETWTITENDAGDLVFTRPGSPTFTIPA